MDLLTEIAQMLCMAGLLYGLWLSVIHHDDGEGGTLPPAGKHRRSPRHWPPPSR